MKRYLKTLRTFWSTALAAEMEYRANFVVALLSSLGGVAGSLFVLSLFYRGKDDLNGWAWEQALLVLGVFTLLEGLSNSMLVPNLNRIVQHVRLGTLDFVLLKPIDPQFWLSTRNMTLWGIPDFILGTGMIVYGGVKSGMELPDYLLATIPIAFAFVIVYSMWFMLGTMSIWFVKIANVTEVLRAFLEAGKYPVTMYPTAYQFFFTFVIPVAFMTSVPAETMLGQATSTRILIGGALALLLLLASRLWWRFASRYYTSASS